MRYGHIIHSRANTLSTVTQTASFFSFFLSCLNPGPFRESARYSRGTRQPTASIFSMNDKGSAWLLSLDLPGHTVDGQSDACATRDGVLVNSGHAKLAENLSQLRHQNSTKSDGANPMAAPILARRTPKRRASISKNDAYFP